MTEPPAIPSARGGEDEADASEYIIPPPVERKALPAVAASVAQVNSPTHVQTRRYCQRHRLAQKDGYEFVRHVRKQGLTTPAVALSAYARAEDRIRSAQTGYQTHLAKPVEPAELLAVIASLAGRYERTAQDGLYAEPSDQSRSATSPPFSWPLKMGSD